VLLNEFFEHAPDAVVFVDAAGRGVRANRKFVQMFGYSQDEIIGTPVSSLIGPPEVETETDCLSPSSPSGTVSVRSVRMRKNGERFEAFIREGALSVSTEAVWRYIICRDTLEAKESEETLAERLRVRLEDEIRQKDRLRLLLDLNNRVASHCGLRQVFHAISSELRRLFRCECVGLALPESSGQTMRQHLIDFPEGKGYFKEGTVFPVESSSAGRAYRTAKAVVLNSFSEVRAKWNSEAFSVFSRIVDNEGTQSVCFLPLLREGRALGVLQLISRRGSGVCSRRC
jgi:formate hydrogenlyase transcriptional activator